MDTPFVYEIRVEGHLSDHWSTWFDGLTIQIEPNGDTKLTGLLSDQAALYGVLAKILTREAEQVLFMPVLSSERTASM
jgi:hypothetical protein